MDYVPLIIAVAAVPAVVSVQVYALVQKMSEPEKMLQPLPEGLSEDKQQIVLAHRDWLAARQLQYLTAFQFGSIQSAVFQQVDAPRFFLIYFHQRVTYELVTKFDELTALETATSGNTGMFPARPGVYRQSFPGANAEVVWQRHLEAEDYLVKKFNIAWQPLTKPFEEQLVNSIRLQMQHVRSIPLYPLRALYWYAVMRQRMANRSIQQQYP